MCLGTMMFGERADEAESDRILGAAIDAGVNFIDTAAMYAGGRTEEILGRIIKGRRISCLSVPRSTGVSTPPPSARASTRAGPPAA